jgi:probable rRNA maturation factor
VIQLAFFNRQRAQRFNFRAVRACAERALPEVLSRARGGSPLPGLSAVEVTFLSPQRICEVHGAFFGDSSPTDVITFPYGEILVCARVAAENARRFNRTAGEEILLCVIHGMLHLAGWDDMHPRSAAAMARVQEEILARTTRAWRAGGGAL